MSRKRCRQFLVQSPLALLIGVIALLAMGPVSAQTQVTASGESTEEGTVTGFELGSGRVRGILFERRP